mmetsp:Transcript_10660/g.19233  ORF Transcript_10660/g.19233 Transcript_10660/m.19233 type:complete len:500 (-) Transcript_10660:1979-3478(-)
MNCGNCCFVTSPLVSGNSNFCSGLISAKNSHFQGQQQKLRAVSLRSRFHVDNAPSFGKNSTLIRCVASQEKVASPPMEKLKFLTEKLALDVQEKYGTPSYVYDLKSLKEQAKSALNFPNAYGLTARFAMKAAPNAAILKIFSSMGMHFDASSGYEVRRAIAAGVEPFKISLSTQELPSDFAELLDLGIEINACSLSQMERIGVACPGSKIGVRFNPGVGSGGTAKTNVGGPSASFGIWHELLPDVKRICSEYDLTVVRIHTHIGSGSDPAIWQRVAGLSLNLCREFDTVMTLNLGGGYKVGRALGEKTTDLQVVGEPVKVVFEQFAEETNRKLHLEIEPGTFMVANTCSLVSTVQDMTTTGKDGYDFLKLDTGMTELLRPSLYGSNHPIVVVPKGREEDSIGEYVVVGHCCESGDLISCEPDDASALQARKMARTVRGDVCVIEGVGAYCSSMSAKNYNSFPEAAELLVDEAGELHLIRERQEIQDMWKYERPLPSGVL